MVAKAATKVTSKSRATHYAATVAVFALVLASASACQKAPTKERVFSVGPEPPPPTETASAVRVYLDGTLSMMGFVTRSQATAYVRTIQALPRSLVAAGWQAHAVTYWKFGTRTEELRAPPVRALDPRFYTDPKINQTTRIDSVIRESPSDHGLTIILTDLFQEDTDVARITGALRDGPFAAHLSLAIIGIRSAFEGVIYDVTPSGASAPYRGLRPFYLLLLGSERDVLRLLGEFRRAAELEDETMRILVVSPRPLDRPIAWPGAISVAVKAPLRENRRGLAVDDPAVKAFDLLSAVGTALVEAEFRVAPLPWGAQLEPGELRVERSAAYWPAPSRLHFWVKRPHEPLPPEAAQLEVDVRRGSGEQILQVAVKLPVSALSRQGVYMYQLTHYAPAAALRLPEWTAEWSLTQEQLRAMERSGRIDGTRTVNLKEFVSDAVRVMLPREGSEVGRLYLYVRKL